MADPYLGEIRMFAGNFAPIDWAFCDGSVLSIQQNTALFSIISTTYGGDGRYNFALPNFLGRSPMGVGNGSGLTPRTIGQYGGAEYVTLTESQLPSHSHDFQVNTQMADETSPENGVMARGKAKNLGPKQQPLKLYATGLPTTEMALNSVGETGGGYAHPNRQPCIGIYFIICLDGMYPIRPS
ncbi:MAG: phage tail protein [Thiomicrospira sp.]